MRHAHWSAAAFALLVAPLASGQTISNGDWSVALDRMGLIKLPPVGGLTSTYGPRVTFKPGGTEWYGVEYMEGHAMVSAVGEGERADWGRRQKVQFVSSSFTPTGGTTVGRVGNLEIEHSFSFDPNTDALIIGVILRNVGTQTMDMVFYTREWSATGVTGVFPPDWEKDLPVAPDQIYRLAWMPNNIGPGRTQGCVLALQRHHDGVGPAAVDVPLQRWKNATWPTGVDFGTCWGIAFTDFDHDSFIDVYSNASRNLWQDLGGTDWSLAASLNGYYPPNFEYGSAWADYNNDQLPDFGSEPRGGCMAFLKNLGGAVFKNVGTDKTIVDMQPCNAESETLSIADVDGDANLDWFLPTYPSWIGSSGNWFLYNKGFDAGVGDYTFHEMSAAAGLDNPPFPVNRPEGAGFADYDYDGDADLYSNNTIYRNLSTPGTALFEAMKEAGSGVVFSDILDEGAGWLDFDMDGDLDLCIAFCDSVKGVRMFDNLGDGQFEVLKKTLFDSATTGLCLGLSYADWDNDGDIDVTTSEVFRRNQWQETLTRHYTVATTSIPAGHITDAVPGWGDFDKDGDLDSALGNWSERGRLYENYTYDSTTPADQRRYTRVKVVRDSDIYDDGLESEYGAQVIVRPLDTSDKFKRVGLVSSSGGYLNQSEYTLHFALPADPDPTNVDVDLHFGVTVDLKGSSTQLYPRVDAHANPVLGSVDLAHLVDREILVYRSGRVKLDGINWYPSVPVDPLATTTGGLALPLKDTALPALTPSPGTDWFVGTEISTANATQPLRLEELILDGHLDTAVTCGTDTGSVFVWDVTNPASPVLAQGGVADFITRPRNNRSYLAMDTVLEPGKVYRIVARVLDERPTPITAPVSNGPVDTTGGLSFQDSTPCTGAGVANATLDPANVYVAVRFRIAPSGAWADFGHALAGVTGDPVLTGNGTLQAGDTISLDLTNANPNAHAFLVVGLNNLSLSLFGGTLVPSFDLVLGNLSTDATGALSVSGTWPAGVPGGTIIYAQYLIEDPAAPKKIAFSNAVAGISPY
jgi:hypothetical protein